MEEIPVIKNILDMSPWEFDQSPEGWRGVERLKGYEDAVKVIHEYLKRNVQRLEAPSSGEPFLVHMLNFHAGQLLAKAGNSDKALEYLNKSFFEGDECWNAYVNATIGFLERDIKKVEDSLNLIESSNQTDKKSGNMAIVRNLLESLKQGNLNYESIYSMPR